MLFFLQKKTNILYGEEFQSMLQQELDNSEE